MIYKLNNEYTEGVIKDLWDKKNSGKKYSKEKERFINKWINKNQEVHNSIVKLSKGVNKKKADSFLAHMFYIFDEIGLECCSPEDKDNQEYAFIVINKLTEDNRGVINTKLDIYVPEKVLTKKQESLFNPDKITTIKIESVINEWKKGKLIKLAKSVVINDHGNTIEWEEAVKKTILKYYGSNIDIDKLNKILQTNF